VVTGQMTPQPPDANGSHTLVWGSLFVLVLENAAFYAAAVHGTPRPELDGLLLCGWMLVPAMSVSILTCNTRWCIPSAAFAGLVTAGLQSHRIVVARYLWETPFPFEIGLRVAICFALSLACAGYVLSIVERLRTRRVAHGRQSVFAGLKIGLLYVGGLALAISSVLILSPPSVSIARSSGPEKRAAIYKRIWLEQAVISATYCAVGIVGGTLAGALIGRVYRPAGDPAENAEFTRHV
jgi:hypothetical protein